MAENASTAASNPAGMTLLDRSQLMTAPGALLPSTNFDVAPQTTTSGGGGGNAGVFMPLGSFFYVHNLSERVRLGVAVFSDYGLGGNPGKTWVGRYYATYESLITGKVNPSIAYEVNNWLSVGAGFSFGVARFVFQSKINNALPRVPDGGLAMESWDEAFGAKVGVLLRPISKLRIGLTYQSPEDYKFGFRPHVTGLGPVVSRIRQRIGGVKVNVPLTEPQQVMASAVYEVLPNFSLMGNVGWQNWSAFGEFPVGISAINQRTSRPTCISRTRVKSRSGSNCGSVKNGCGPQDLRMTARRFRPPIASPSCLQIASCDTARASSIRSIAT